MKVKLLNNIFYLNTGKEWVIWLLFCFKNQRNLVQKWNFLNKSNKMDFQSNPKKKNEINDILSVFTLFKCCFIMLVLHWGNFNMNLDYGWKK